MNKVYEYVFYYGTNISYFLYILALFGVGGYAPEYLQYLKMFLKYYIGFLLVILFNPFIYIERKFSDFDRKIAFSAGVFLLLSSTIISSIEQYLTNQTKDLIQTYVI